MPIFMDRHDISGASAKDVALAHQEDLKIQHEFGCVGKTYWIDEEKGIAFCLIEAPNKEAVHDMHNKAHGLLPNEIIEVDDQIVMAFLGRIHDPIIEEKGALPVFSDPAFRAILFIKMEDLTLLKAIYGNTKAQSVKNIFYNQLKNTAEKYHGRMIERSEKYLFSFVSVTKAVDFAKHIQKSFQKLLKNEKLDKIRLNMGLTAGVPVNGDKDIFGDTIKTAKRLSFISDHYKIKTSAVIRELYKGDHQIDFSKDGDFKSLNSEEEDFLNLLINEIEASIDDQDFKLDDLCKSMGISQSQLYRKTILVTGYSPNDLIKEIRLRKAIEMFEKQNKNISEVSYQLGFANPSYFSKCFKERFNILPTDFLNNLE